MTPDRQAELQRLCEELSGSGLLVPIGASEADLVDGFRDALAEIDRLTAQVREAEWQPIATAPKDVEVWACGGELHPYVAKLIEVDEFIGVREGSRLAMRWHNLSANRYSRPTHWQPLPPPPAREGSEG